MLKSPKKNIWKLFIVIKMDWVHSKKSKTDLKILLIQVCHDSRCKLFQQPHEKKVYGKSWNNEFFGERKQKKFSISSRRLLFIIIFFFVNVCTQFIIIQSIVSSDSTLILKTVLNLTHSYVHFAFSIGLRKTIPLNKLWTNNFQIGIWDF